MISMARDASQRSRPAAVWLLVVAALILAMVVVGGATRATGSGLSITQWRPVSGVIPPLDHAAWERMFSLYQATPQYRLINRGMDLAQFQSIFWWEWSHRLLGRLLGVVFFVPFIVLLALRLAAPADRALPAALRPGRPSGPDRLVDGPERPGGAHLGRARAPRHPPRPGACPVYSGYLDGVGGMVRPTGTAGTIPPMALDKCSLSGRRLLPVPAGCARRRQSRRSRRC